MTARSRAFDRSIRGALATCAFACAALVPSRGRAAGEQESRAQRLFEAAKELQDSGQIADACPMFAESQSLAPGVGVTLHLADCYERAGKLASAWRQFHAAERMAHERGDDRRAELAHRRSQALESKLNRLTVTMGAGAHDGWQVAIDGAPLPADRWNVALAVDPGDHVVGVQEPGQPPRTLKVHLEANGTAIVNADGRSRAAPVRTTAAVSPTPPPSSPPVPSSGATATLPLPSATALQAQAVPAELATPATQAPPPTAAVSRFSSPSEPAAPPAHQAAPQETSAGGSGTRLGIAIGLAGLGALGAGFGTFFLVRRSVFMSHDCTCDVSLENEASTWATVSFGVGGAALASSAVLLLTGAPQKPTVGWVLAPTAVPGGAGALVRASF
jgi:hypothetical protein